MHKNKFRFAIVLFATLSVLIMGFSSLKTASAASCGTPNVTTNPSGSASKGTSVTISASVTCDGGVGKMEIRVGMSTLATNSGSSSISATWNTGNADVGNVRIYVNAWPNGSDSPFDKGSQQVDYTITQGSGGGNPTQPPPPPNATNPPQATIQPNPGGKCTITSIRTNPSGSARRGAVVNISATSSCSGGTGKMEIVVGMSVVARNSGSASISVNWNSSNGYIGNNNIYVSAYANGNDSEFDKAKGDLNFILTEGNPPPQATAPPAFTPRPSDPTATQYVAPGPLYPQAQLADGGIHLGEYCKAKHGDRAVEQHSSDDAYSFRCLGASQGQLWYIDFPAACPEVYGQAKPYATLGSSYDLGGWKCSETQGYIDPPHSGGRPAPTKGAITSTPIAPPPPSGNCDGVYASRLSVGMRGEVIRDGRGPTTLRSGPSVTYGTIVSMPEGTQFNVIGGPECASTRSGINVYFWKLKLDNGAEGWAVEHIDGNYAIGPVSGPGPITLTPTRATIPFPILLKTQTWKERYGTDDVQVTTKLTYQRNSNGTYMLRTLSLDYDIAINVPAITCWSVPKAMLRDASGKYKLYFSSISNSKITFGIAPFMTHQNHVDYQFFIDALSTDELELDILWGSMPADNPGWNPLTEAAKSEIQKQAESAVSNDTVKNAPAVPRMFTKKLDFTN